MLAVAYVFQASPPVYNFLSRYEGIQFVSEHGILEPQVEVPFSMSGRLFSG